MRYKRSSRFIAQFFENFKINDCNSFEQKRRFQCWLHECWYFSFAVIVFNMEKEKQSHHIVRWIIQQLLCQTWLFLWHKQNRKLQFCLRHKDTHKRCFNIRSPRKRRKRKPVYEMKACTYCRLSTSELNTPVELDLFFRLHNVTCLLLWCLNGEHFSLKSISVCGLRKLL